MEKMPLLEDFPKGLGNEIKVSGLASICLLTPGTIFSVEESCALVMKEELVQPSTNAFALAVKVNLLPTPPTISGSHIKSASSFGSKREIVKLVIKGKPITASEGSTLGRPLVGCTLIKVVLALL